MQKMYGNLAGIVIVPPPLARFDWSFAGSKGGVVAHWSPRVLTIQESSTCVGAVGRVASDKFLL